MWYLYTIEFYSVTKKNEILSFTSTWMELENIIVSIVRLRRPKSHIFSLMWIIDLKQIQYIVGHESHT
jgi:hypothetical protein